MNKNILKTTFVLGTMAAVSAGIVAMLSDEGNKKKIKNTADDFSKKANTFVKEMEEEYKELDSNLKAYTKTKEYKNRVEEVTTASKEILKQMQILKENTSALLLAFKKQAEKARD